MKVFLTGGTGFIGSHFINEAHKNGHEIVAHRRTEESKPKTKLDKDPCWLTKPLDELSAEDFEGCEALVHLASPGVTPQKASFSELIYWNVSVLERLLSKSFDGGITRYVIAGTFAEYGSSALKYDKIPVTANLEPTYAYAASKAASFNIAHAFSIMNNIKLAYLRIFSAYGEGQHEDNFWPSLRKAALAGEDFNMTPGEQIRDYMSATEVVNQFLGIMISGDLTSGKPIQKNVASGKPISMKDFAQYWWKEFESEGKLRIGALPYRDNEVMRYVPEV